MHVTNLTGIIIVLLILLGLSAFFSGSETALMAISRLRLRHLARTKPKGAHMVERMLKKPERLIGTILLGNNLVNVTMSAIATAVAIGIWGERGIVYVTAVLTVAILIFAEITPKVYAKYFNERVSFLTAPILYIIMLVFYPLVLVVTFVSNKLLYAIGINVSKIKRPLMTEEEIKTCIGLGLEEGAITHEEKRMLSSVFTLNDKTVGQVMLPLKRMTVLPVNASLKQIRSIILKTGYSRFPVKKVKDADIIGFIHAKDLFAIKAEKQSRPLKKILRPAYFVPEDKAIDAQLLSFKARRLHQAVVLNKDGKVSGLVTLEDILEELVGSIQDEHDELE